MRRLTPEIGLIVCVVLLAVAYLWADSQLPSSSLGDPLGPRVFPALIGAGLLVSAALMVLEMIGKRHAPPVAPKGEPGEPAEPEGGEPAMPRASAAVLAGMVAWTAAYYVCLTPVGYLISTLVFLGGLLSFFNRRRHVMNVIVAVSFTLIVDALFTYALGMPVAEGILSI